MRKRSIGRGLALAGIATLALGLNVGGAAAGNGKGKAYGKLAAKSCAKEKKALGKEAFGEMYGKPAMPNCIGVVRKDANAEAKNAAKECKAEREDPTTIPGNTENETFKEFYGTNKNGKNAFGKCVSGKVREDVAEERADRINAAKECKAEREDPTTIPGNTENETFEEFYGTNKNGKNAFGKCVSGKAKAQNDEEEPTETE
jgi:hypothetical protein